jgi:hypothetical protein
MRERKIGKIVNISSTAGHATDGRPLYSTAKAGVNHYTKMLAQQLRPYNITCNALSPGPTRSGRWLANTGAARKWACERVSVWACACADQHSWNRVHTARRCRVLTLRMHCMARRGLSSGWHVAAPLSRLHWLSVLTTAAGSDKDELVSEGTLDRIGLRKTKRHSFSHEAQPFAKTGSAQRQRNLRAGKSVRRKGKRVFVRQVRLRTSHAWWNSSLGRWVVS